jgi:hypothetical protein
MDPFIRGLTEGYGVGYAMGYGYTDPIIPETKETNTRSSENDRSRDDGKSTEPREDGKVDPSRPDKPYPIEVRSFFKPLVVITEKYDQDSYALSYSVEDRTGFFQAKIGIAGDLHGTGIVIPERAHFGFDLVDYPFKSRSGMLAVIAYSGCSHSSWMDPIDDANITAEDDGDYLPLWKLSAEDASGSYKVTTWEKHEYSWEDLHSKGKTGSYGLIYSLQDASVPPGNGTEGADPKESPSTVSDARNVVEKGSLLPIAVTVGIGAATLALIAVLAIAGIAIYRKRTVW